jgi:hypothetical protein
LAHNSLSCLESHGFLEQVLSQFHSVTGGFHGETITFAALILTTLGKMGLSRPESLPQSVLTCFDLKEIFSSVWNVPSIRRFMKKAGFLSLFFLLVVSVAQAEVRVTCKNQDCLRAGWSVLNMQNQMTADLSCITGDCTQFGWTVQSTQGTYTARCMSAGCFAEGWTEYFGNGMSNTYLCSSDSLGHSDCLKYGWSHISGPDEAFCLGGSCRANGWVIRQPGYPDRRVVCNAAFDEDVQQTVSDCFRFGWNAYP